MAQLIVGRAYEPGRGMCIVEEVGGGWFRLIPDRNPNDAVLRPRERIQWRTSRRAA